MIPWKLIPSKYRIGHLPPRHPKNKILHDMSDPPSRPHLSSLHHIFFSPLSSSWGEVDFSLCVLFYWAGWLTDWLPRLDSVWEQEVFFTFFVSLFGFCFLLFLIKKRGKKGKKGKKGKEETTVQTENGYRHFFSLPVFFSCSIWAKGFENTTLSPFFYHSFVFSFISSFITGTFFPFWSKIKSRLTLHTYPHRTPTPKQKKNKK